ncbi:glycosyltransferase family 2 protein [Bacillus haimaensis]|uniref:glycosyltransferase family 2 protein n=1 Tax=Bacillus haimaensis TaxID=3160967 RepID=UPI003AA8594E
MSLNHKPLVSIITPSFNQGKFIKETIESVLTQDYSNLEHIVVDGGSTDETLQLLRDYRTRDPRFRFISEPDNGQSHAINKGLNMARGEIIGWLNSDDTYLPGAVTNALNTFNLNSNLSMVYGNAYITDEKNQNISQFVARRVRLTDLFKTCPICQPAVFLKKKTLVELNGIDESLDFCMDYDLWIRIAKAGYEMGVVKAFLANSRYYPESKSGSKFCDVGFPEIIKTSKKHFGFVSHNWFILFLKHYRDKGALWFLQLFRSSSIFKDSPIILDKAIKHTDYRNVKIQAQPNNPVHGIIVEGNQDNYESVNCSFYLDNVQILQTRITKGPFSLTIPIISPKNTNEFTYICNEGKAEPHIKVLKLFALSKEEFEFYKVFDKGDMEVKRWVKLNIKYE